MVTSILSQDEINTNAIKFSERWKDEKSEKSEAQTFVNEFYAIFGLDRKLVASFEAHPANTPDFIDCIQKDKFMIEMKSHGKNLYEAMGQALDYYKELKQSELPKYILACDFQNWYLLDKQDNSEYHFGLTDLVDNIGLFGFMIDKPKVVKADPVNHDAVIIIGKIFDELKKADFSSGESSYFLTRVVFCLFADDVGIFPDRDMFQNYIKNNTVEDGSDTGSRLQYLFDNVLNKHWENRSKNMGSKIRFFPYINGELFAGGRDIPDFNQNMRKLLIEAGEYDWSKVSPAIFGTMFQSVMDQDKRHETGSHYTTEENILKVIRPLFLDNLNKEFDEIDRITDDFQKDRFIKFQNKMVSMKFLDPACGSGNFLVVAYRELRRLEHRIIIKIHGFDSEKLKDTEKLSKMDVSQFFGIEIGEFSAKIAEISLWMMDHMMNVELSNMMEGLRYRRIPIKQKPNIMCRDALEFDWNEILPATECDYVFGNPPFNGSKTMTVSQREQIKKISNISKGGGTLDYVTGWFFKASEYANDKTRIGFVSTNSITQGEQVGQLWPALYERYKINIVFAYKSFKWYSESKGMAQVTVVILGLDKRHDTIKRLFHMDGNGTIEEKPNHITPYLTGTEKPLPIVKESSKQLNGLNKMRMGSKPIDGGNYIFTDDEKDRFLAEEPGARDFFRPYVNADEFLNGNMRSILALHDTESDQLRELPRVMERVNAVMTFRKASSDKGTRRLGDNPKFYHLNVLPENPFLLVPSTTSEKREYVPMGYVEPPTIPSNATMIVENASLGLFGLLTSKMHMIWLKNIGGKLETRLRYSAGMVYNTFPVPDSDLDILIPFAQKILDERQKHPDSTLADMYDLVSMPPELKKAHQKLDKKVEKLYRKKSFTSDDQRLEFLLDKYQKMIQKNQSILN